MQENWQCSPNTDGEIILPNTGVLNRIDYFCFLNERKCCYDILPKWHSASFSYVCITWWVFLFLFFLLLLFIRALWTSPILVKTQVSVTHYGNGLSFLNNVLSVKSYDIFQHLKRFDFCLQHNLQGAAWDTNCIWTVQYRFF